MSWLEYFIAIAEVVARKSKDPSTQVGCLLVGDDNEIISTGFNGFARGIDEHDPARWERPEKYSWVVHAELNALLNAARIGSCTNGSRAYVQMHPCSGCANALVQAGVREINVVASKVPVMHRDGQDLARAKTILQEAGVKILIHTAEES